MESMVTTSWCATSISWEKSKLWTERLSFILIVVKVWTVRFLAFKSLATCMNLVIKWMIFLFFPTMGEFTAVLIFTAICISLNKMLCFPLRALLSFIIKNMRLPSEILPIMSIDAGISWMLSIRVRTPYSLKMEHIEISWVLIFMRIRSEFV